MTRFSADTLDLSRFPPPLAIRDYDYDRILRERLQRAQSLFDEAGIEIRVLGQQSNPSVILERTDAYRETLAIAAVNDAVRACMIAFAVGVDLDHLAAFYAVQRRMIAPATLNEPAVMEGDEELRRRVLFAPEAFAAAGPRGAYVYHALTADPRVLNADVWTPAPGEVVVALQSREGSGEAPEDLIDGVRSYLDRDDIRPLTDVISVRSVRNAPYAIAGTGYVLRGPDPASVEAEAIEALKAMAARRRTPARDVPRSAAIAAASVGPMDKVILREPGVDIARGLGEVPVLTGIDFKVETYAG